MAVASMKDWLPSRGRVPSWVLSGLFHAALVWGVLSLMPMWDRPPVGDSPEPTREIGIFVKQQGEDIDPNEAETPSAKTSEKTTPQLSDPLSPPQAVPELPEMSSAFPKASSLPAIGPGTALPSGGLPDPDDLIKPRGVRASSGDKSGGLPGASFMGVKDHGSRVVYVVDCSSSMDSHNAMRAAKAALVASLNGLEKSQQFQILFYNERTRLLSLKSVPKQHLYFATDLNKTAAQQFINSIEPDLGTKHLDALMLGLSFGAEVMFVLTDSGEPALTPSELDQIQRRNGGKTRIHSIEFGIGEDLPGVSNFLKKLAEKNGGTHRYVDVTQFSRKEVKPRSRP